MTAGVYFSMVGPFIFRCPATGLNVQHIFDEEVPEIGIERRYEAVQCLACTGIHLIRGRQRPIRIEAHNALSWK